MEDSEEAGRTRGEDVVIRLISVFCFSDYAILVNDDIVGMDGAEARRRRIRRTRERRERN